MTAPFLFVGGMFRSGTTLLGRILDSHPDLSLASDPYLPFFKQIRSLLAKELGADISVRAPLDDYYFSNQGIELLKKIQNHRFEHSVDNEFISVLIEELTWYGERNFPWIIPYLNQVQGNSLSEIFESMISILARYYRAGNPNAKWVGFKSVWSNEFIRPLATTFADAKFIEIVRDPRAVCASQNVKAPYYPWFFLGRQWRKLAAVSYLHQHDQALQPRVHCVYYEKLIQEPQKTLESICEFLDVDFYDSLLDPRTYQDDQGLPWIQNTSYGQGKSDFDTQALERWKNILSAQEISLIEYLCQVEMTLHGYELNTRSFPDDFNLNFPMIPSDQLADWIRAEYDSSSLGQTLEMAKETLRYSVLQSSQTESLSAELIEASFLFPEIVSSYKNIS